MNRKKHVIPQTRQEMLNFLSDYMAGRKTTDDLIESNNLTLSTLHKSQRQIVKESDRFNVVCCGRRFGKSKLSVNLLCEPAALDSSPVGYFAPTYKLLEET